LQSYVRPVECGRPQRVQLDITGGGEQVGLINARGEIPSIFSTPTSPDEPITRTSLTGARLPDTDALMADNGEILDFLRARFGRIDDRFDRID